MTASSRQLSHFFFPHLFDYYQAISDMVDPSKNGITASLGAAITILQIIKCSEIPNRQRPRG
jgi:hypothetical protein